MLLNFFIILWYRVVSRPFWKEQMVVEHIINTLAITTSYLRVNHLVGLNFLV
jgi:hypothetical protein